MSVPATYSATLLARLLRVKLPLCLGSHWHHEMKGEEMMNNRQDSKKKLAQKGFKLFQLLVM